MSRRKHSRPRGGATVPWKLLLGLLSSLRTAVSNYVNRGGSFSLFAEVLHKRTSSRIVSRLRMVSGHNPTGDKAITTTTTTPTPTTTVTAHSPPRELPLDDRFQRQLRVRQHGCEVGSVKFCWLKSLRNDSMSVQQQLVKLIRLMGHYFLFQSE